MINTYLHAFLYIRCITSYDLTIFYIVEFEDNYLPPEVTKFTNLAYGTLL